MNMGAQGITVHPRPDERHIKRQDVYELKNLMTHYNEQNNAHVEFNIEGFPSEDFLELIQDVQPEQVTLVPDPPDVLTSPTPQAVQSLWPSHPDAAVHSVPASHSDGALQLARSPETTFGARHS